MKPSGLSNVIDLETARAADKEQRAARSGQDPPGLAKRPRPRKIIAVGGGKGGIGKTLVSANLGIALARAGNRVVLVDVDLGGANLHTTLGVPAPQHTLSDFMNGRTTSINDVIIPSGIENVTLIAGSQDVLDAANPKYQQKVKLLRGIQLLDADYVLLDLGAGSSFNILDFFLVADHGILVLLPEPTSVENAYRFIKAAFFRRLQYLSKQFGIEALVEEALSTRQGALRTPYDFVARIKADNPQVGLRVEAELRSFRIRLIVNQARTPADQNVGLGVVAAWKKFFGLEMDYLGAIRYDDEAWRAIRKRRPVLVEQPDCDAARGITQVAQKLLALDGRLPPPLVSPP